MAGDAAVTEYNWDISSPDGPLADEDLRRVFKPIDAAANAAKAVSRKWGYIAIGLGAGSLCLASLALRLPDCYELWLSKAAALAGVVSLAIGLIGVLHATPKRRWLELRYQTERLRQFHFQSAIALLPELLGAIKHPSSDRFKSERKKLFERFTPFHLNEAAADRLGAILREEDKDGWMFDKMPTDPIPGDAAFAEFERSYKFYRLAGQIDYCDKKLRKRKLVLLPITPAEQSSYFGTVAIFCIVGATLLHVVTAGLPDAVISHGAKISLNVGVLWLAVAVLAVRAFEEGLRPHRETERYRQYRAALRSVETRLNAAETPLEKIAAMKELEQISFEEMTNFLKEHDEAKFVM